MLAPDRVELADVSASLDEREGRTSAVAFAEMICWMFLTYAK